MKKIYFTSDLHLSHNKDFIYKARGFNSIEEHDEELIKRFNSIVTPEDDLWILGDLMLGDNDEGIKKIKQLNGNLHIIYGNHDTNARILRYAEELDNAEIHGFATTFKYKKKQFMLSHYPTITSNMDDGGAPIKAKVINLCGHSHIKNRFKDMDKGLIYHVEIDCHNNFPISLDEILFDINHFISMDKNDQIDIVKKDIY